MKYIYFTVNTPLSHCDLVRQAIGSAGAGIIGEYSFCSFTTKGVGRSIPTDKAKQKYGKQNILSLQNEEKIESFCVHDKLENVISAIRAVHPYEEPAIVYWEVEIV